MLIGEPVAQPRLEPGTSVPFVSMYSTIVEDSGITASPSTSTGMLAGGQSRASSSRPSTSRASNGTSSSYSAIRTFWQYEANGCEYRVGVIRL